VLDEFGERCGLNIEIKSLPGIEPDSGIEVKVAQAIANRNLYSSAMVSSFDPTRLEKLHALDSRISIGLLVTSRASDYPEGVTFWQLIEQTGANAFHPPYQLVDAALVEEAHRRGLPVNTWTVNDRQTATQLIELGVDMLMGNFIGELKAALNS
jgi:glycerophosphoryl diester phosphodiesterase